MTTRLFSNPRPHFTLDDGATSNTNGRLYFYEPGIGSTTLKYVYSKSPFIAANRLTNPVYLDGNGFAPTIMLDGDYRVKLTDKNGVTIWDVPNYQEADLSAQFSDWDATITYSIYDYVRGSNGSYYQSLSSGNVGNNPVGNTTYWVKAFVTPFALWDSAYIYAVDDFTRGSDGNYYQSLTASNLNNNPTSSAANWVQIYFIDIWNTNKTYAANDIVKYLGSMYVSLQGSNTGNNPDATESAYWRSFFEPLIATNYTAVGFEYRNTDGYNGTVFDVDANVTTVTWESLGPTGSGADNIWTAMDDMPAESKFAIVRAAYSGTRTATTDDSCNASMSARTTGGSASIGFSEVFNVFSYGGASNNEARVSGTQEFTVPVDSSRRFDVRWFQNNFNTSFSISLYFVGYKL